MLLPKKADSKQLLQWCKPYIQFTYEIRKLHVSQIVSVLILENCGNLELTEQLENWDNRLRFCTEGSNFLVTSLF